MSLRVEIKKLCEGTWVYGTVESIAGPLPSNIGGGLLCDPGAILKVSE